ARRAAAGAARGDRRPPVGRADVRRDRPPGGLFAADGPPPLPGGTGRAARKAGGPMDAPVPRPEDLSALEQRLAAWRPSPEGLDADRMLFAAGRASAAGPRARLLWPAAAACLALLSASLGAWLVSERGERLALARQLRQKEAAPAPAPAPTRT